MNASGRTRAAEAELLERLRTLPAGSAAARRVEDELARAFSNVVVREATRVASRSGVAAGELVQVGMLEVMLLWRRFRPAPGRNLGGAYVAQVVRQAMQRHAQDSRSLVYVPRTVRKRAKRARLAAQAAGKSVEELLAGRELTIATVQAVEVAETAVPAPVAAVLNVEASLERADDALTQRQRWAAVQAALSRLPRLERYVLQAAMGFGFDAPVPDSAIARTLRLSTEAVMRTREEAIERLQLMVSSRL